MVGNTADAMVAYGMGDLGETDIALNEVDRLIAIGSDGMMRAVARARHGVLEYLQPEHKAIGSINSPMQRMMKEICAQCLQHHNGPKTGEETVVFSCLNQDQSLHRVDFGNLRTRLSQNGVPLFACNDPIVAKDCLWVVETVPYSRPRCHRA